MTGLIDDLYHPTWDIIDSTKTRCFLDCPRKYFYEYILGWTPDRPRHDLEFGEAWHQALPVFYEYGFSEDSLKLAAHQFMTHYRKHFQEATDLDYAPKSPGNALVALHEYSQRYNKDLELYEVLHIEVAGTVMIMKDKNIHFRCDAILRDRKTDEMLFLEHKTTKQFGRTWTDQWALSVQLGTYTHVINCLYGPEKTYGGLVNGVAFMKKGNDFVRLPIRKTLDMMNVWHWSMCHTLHEMDHQMHLLSKCTKDDRIMEAYPLNPESCTKYWGCAYHDLCCAWANPLRHVEQPPIGFLEYRWDPSAREAKEIIEV